MYRIEHDWALWLLVIIPLMLIIYWLVLRWKKKARARFAESRLMDQLMPRYSPLKRAWKFVFFILAFFFLVLGIANPQIGTKLEEIKREGIDLIIALDVSNSMMAEDLSPNRLERAKRAMLQLLEELHSDRIGIIVFAGQAYTQLPVTTDYAAAKLFLNTVDTDAVPTQGTAIGAAVELAEESFNYEDGGNKALIIVTDGENHEDDAIEASRSAAEKGIRIFTIGMGTPMGSPIPVIRNGRKMGYRQDGQGNTIVSSLNEAMLREIAGIGNGTYTRATNSSLGFERILDQLSGLKKNEFESQVYTDYEDRFQFFLGAAFFFFMLFMIMGEKKSKWKEKIKLFEA